MSTQNTTSRYQTKQTKPLKKEIPFKVETELNPFTKMYITKENDLFKIAHFCQSLTQDYQIFGEMSDESKKLLFTVSEHFECECCCCCNCDQIGFDCCCFSLMLCDKILYQLDYKKNNQDFYTQGRYQQKGFQCKIPECHCCNLCPYHTLYLRENTDHDDADFDKGTKKGRTETLSCSFCSDKTSVYTTEENKQGYGIRATCSEIYRRKYLKMCCNATHDFEIEIENENGEKVGNIMLYSGLCSDLVKDKCCYVPKPYFEINMPKNASSIQKFQIIADIIHFDYANGLL